MRHLGILVLCLLPSIAAAQPLQPVEILHRFPTSPSHPDGALVEVPDGSFYGVTFDAIYRVAPGGAVTIVARLTDGFGAKGALVRGPDGALYGTTQWGGDGGVGTVFRFDPVTVEVRTLHAFSGHREGGSPVDGLTVVGSQLYGVTPSTAFRVDPTTGVLTVIASFVEATPSIYDAAGGLTLAADGLLYGTSRLGPDGAGIGTIYRLDPATGAVTIVHAFSPTATRTPLGRLRRGPDNRLYGTARSDQSSGTVYRYDPSTDTFDVLYEFPDSPTVREPGPVEILPDLSVYGLTSGPSTFSPSQVTMLFRLRPTGGSYAFEALRSFGAADGQGTLSALTRGSDALLYGYARHDGVAGAGTVFRFDPEAAGPPSDPLSFVVLHAFAPATTWGPSVPAAGANGLLYGTTSVGGAASRGGIYVLDPATGGITIAASVPGTLPLPGRGVNSTLVLGADNALYATSAAATTATPGENGIIRFVPGAGSATNTVTAAVIESGLPTNETPLARSGGGALYFARGASVYRVANDSTVAAAGSGPSAGTTSLPPVTAADGHVYVGMVSILPGPEPFQPIRRTRIFRVNATSNQLDQVADLGGDDLSSLAPAPGGGLYLGSAFVGGGSNSAVRLLDVTTLSVSPVCTWPAGGLSTFTTVGGRIAGLTSHGGQRLLLCEVATGAIEIRSLPAAAGTLRGITAIGDVLYGASAWTPVDEEPFAGRRAVRANPGGALLRFRLGASPPPLDSESDGLPNEWESTFGLDPFDATADDGASGDPDGDGRTNAQELAEGTHPRGVVTRYFAEGATGPFFRTRLHLANGRDGRPATVLLRFLTDTGARVTHPVSIAPGGHRTVDVETVPGLAHATFSTVIEADGVVAADRTMSWDASGYGSTVETAVTAPATTWYLAEGSTSGAFSLFYLLQNPHPTAVSATVRYLRPFGQAPIDRTYSLPPNSRTTILVDEEGAELASTDLSAVITASAPIVAERAMYYSQPGVAFAAGHESAGVTAPALEWFLAEGATGAFFDLFVLIANPNPTAATVDVEYLRTGGGSLTKTYTVAANSRFTIFVDDEQLPAGSGTRPLAETSVSMAVRSTNAQPIVVERTMWWPSPTLAANFWYEAHNSPGATTTASRWLVAGVEDGDAARTYLLIANPSPVAGQAIVSRITELGRASGSLFHLPPKSRTSIPLQPINASLTASSVLVESIGTNPVPIVVEHANYASPGGVLWGSGGNALATPLP